MGLEGFEGVEGFVAVFGGLRGEVGAFGGDLLAGALVEGEAGFVDEVEELGWLAVDELGAELDGGVADVLGEDAAADAGLGFEDGDAEAGLGEGAGGGEAGHAGTEDEDVGGAHRAGPGCAAGLGWELVAGGPKRSKRKRRACSGVWRVPSSWASSAASSMDLKVGPGW